MTSPRSPANEPTTNDQGSNDAKDSRIEQKPVKRVLSDDRFDLRDER